MIKNKGLLICLVMMTLVMFVFFLSACSNDGDPKGTVGTVREGVDDVELIWYLRGGTPNNADSVIAKANEIIKEKINAVVDFRFVQPGDYNERMQMVMAASEVFDICWTSNWANNYLENVSKGAYLPLDDMLENYPLLKDAIPEMAWEAARVDGNIYGVFNRQMMHDQKGLWFKKDLIEKYNINLDEVNKLEDLTQIYQIIKDNEPNVTPIRKGYPNLDDYRITSIAGFTVDIDTWEVYDGVKELVEGYHLMRDWYKRDYFPQDVATMQDENAIIRAGRIFSRYQRISYGSEIQAEENYGFEVVTKSFGPSVITRGTIQSTLSAISITSENPNRALELLELMNTDKELYNLMVFGIEGQDYKKVDENRIETLEEGYSFSGWQLGSQLNSYLLPGQPDDMWEVIAKDDAEAIVDPLIGFYFDRSNVESELAQISAVNAEFNPILENGLDDPDKILQMREEKMIAAGRDKVIEEIKRQLNEWKELNQ